MLKNQPRTYVKKPVQVEAMLYDGTETSIDAIFQWTGGDHGVECHLGQFKGQEALVIPTLEGDHYALVGDYIIKGVKGEFYPCKPDIFKQIYELTDWEKQRDGDMWPEKPKK